MPKQVYDFNGTKVRASNPTAASSLASEVSGQAYQAPAAIPVSQLQNPATPIKIPPQQPAMQSDGMLGFLGAGADQFNKTLQTQAEQAQKPLGDLQSQIAQVLNAPGEAQLTNKAYKTAGVDTAQTELQDINNQMLAEQNGLKQQIEQLQKNPAGFVGNGLADKIQELKDASLSRQANLAVIQLSKQGQFDSAKAIADRAVSASLEASKNKLNTLQFLYQENKDMFDKKEQRAFETAQQDRQRALDFKEYELKAQNNQILQKEMLAYEQKIKQSDPLYALQIAKMRKEISLLGEPTAKEKADTAAQLKEAKASVPVMQDKIAAVDALEQHPGLAARVGTSVLSRGTPSLLGKAAQVGSVVGIPAFIGSTFRSATGEGQDFAGGVHKLVSGLTLQNLIDAKARGATFGALSEGELGILANSASAINDWEIKDANGRGTGYWNIDEASFKKELDNVRTLTQRALQQSGQSLLSADEQASLDSIFNADNAAAYFK